MNPIAKLKDVTFLYQKFEYFTKYISTERHLEPELNAFGNDGWNLAGTWPQTIGTEQTGIVLIFKRQKY